VLTGKERKLIYIEIKDHIGWLESDKDNIDMVTNVIVSLISAGYKEWNDFLKVEPEIRIAVKDFLVTIRKMLDHPLKSELSILKSALAHQSKALTMSFVRNDPRTASTIAKEVERLQRELILLTEKSTEKGTKNRIILKELEKLEAQIPIEYMDRL
jgi:hypothetical protein